MNELMPYFVFAANLSACSHLCVPLRPVAADFVDEFGTPPDREHRLPVREAEIPRLDLQLLNGEKCTYVPFQGERKRLTTRLS